MTTEGYAGSKPSRKRAPQSFPRSRERNPGLGWSLTNFSKGIDVYGFLDPQFGDKGVTLSFSVPPNPSPPKPTPDPNSQTMICTTGFQPAAQNGALATPLNFQVESENLSFFGLYGNFYWNAWVTNGTVNASVPLFTQQFSINPYTGNSGGAVTDLLNTPSFAIPANTAGNGTALSVSYGFYDAGPGYSGLPNQDQFYVYVTNSYNNWMKNAVSAQLNIANLPLSQWCLPGAHDAGMCTMATVYDMLDTIDSAELEMVLWTVFTVLSLPIIGPLAPGAAGYAVSNAPVIMQNLAITQKDSIATMLQSGIRYFDFRPGYMYGLLPSMGGVLFHQHACVPGYGYINFLADVISFCAQNPEEIVVINLNDSGFVDVATMSPTDDDLNAAWLAACALATSNPDPNIPPTQVWNIAPVGGTAALAATYSQLVNGQLNQTPNSGSSQPITSNQIVFLYQMTNATGAPFDFTATKWDSYSNDVYATLNPLPISEAFQEMLSQTSPNDYTVLQCQGTATNIPQVAGAAILSPTLSSSPLMATKPAFDSNNLGWIWNNGSKFSSSQLLVILNDFADNATAATAMQVNTQRLPGFPQP